MADGDPDAFTHAIGAPGGTGTVEPAGGSPQPITRPLGIVPVTA
ncbi:MULTISPECIES: hypothetical protein [unclassified Streptomyces]